MFRCGAAEVDVTPDLGIRIFGDIGRPRPAEVIADPLYAKAMVLESAGKRLCFVSLDIGTMTEHWTNKIRTRAKKEYGLDPESVLIHCSQTHSAPSMGHIVCREGSPLLRPEDEWICSDERYSPFAVDRIIESIGRAIKALEPAKIGAASEIDPRVAFNRRFVMRDGTVKCNPHGKDRLNILHAEGPADPEVGVVAIQSEDALTSLMLHHTCHPTHGYPTRVISADWPGTWSDAMKAQHGGAIVPLVVNGCCGNVLHANWADAHFINDQKRMGTYLAESASMALSRIQYRDSITLDAVSRKIKLPYRAIKPEELASAQKLLREHPTPKPRKDDPSCVEWDWVYAVSIVDFAETQQRSSTRDYEIQVLRLGDTGLVGLDGEPFVEAQLEIKRLSPVRHTYVAHNSNGFGGYLPTKHAFKGGGYETRTANWSMFVPEALDIVTAETVKLLKEVFAK
ncbi:MAG TPA: hypothetical protein VEJ63_02870 [Planctomycetota bacterium]|nr:hypothetical protein [Planctomycetota bacterium]